MIPDEPARGSVPPPWFWALSGLDRMRGAENDRTLLSGSFAGVFVDAARRTERPGQRVKRVLTSILVTDIVASSGHAERLGDDAWRELLSRPRARWSSRAP